MGLAAGLAEREAAGQPVRVGLIGAGAFGTMFLAQGRRTPGIHIVAVADLEPERAQAALAGAGWRREDYRATTIADAASTGRTCVTAETENLMDGAIDVMVEATGSPTASIAHALAAFGGVATW
jgi:predicted homoserine dehydrogenase-like protein